MNKKVFTLLPIFSLFALTNCGGSTPSPTPTHNDNYWVVDFESNGGTHVPFQRVSKEGGTATQPTPPTKPDGSAFEGWYESASFDGPVYTFTTTVNDDLTLYAKWGASPTPTVQEYSTTNADEFKAAVDLAFDEDFITHKYVGATITYDSTSGDHLEASISGVTADGTGSALRKFEMSGQMSGVQNDILNSARVDVLKTTLFYYTIYYVGDSYKTGVVTGFTLSRTSSGGDSYSYNNHCVLIEAHDTYSTDTYTYNLDPQ